jgi:hypothetical protein
MQKQKSKGNAWNAGWLTKKGANQGKKEDNTEFLSVCPNINH